ncbi:right-handed parallel beta-helix repeat-containing protein [Paenibacillus sp. FSL H8-0034]|uniref:right-handed parallel beta-helix repeat-containing protein n=1 Tax=Paenibacillus sp. FSL H8-0034 TaxID=2954671 RepID=UPI0030F4F86D
MIKANIGDIDDIDLTSKLPANNDVLTFDSTISKWIPKALSSSGAASSREPANSIYVIELARWGISNNGLNPLATTQGINNALIWANQNGFTTVKLPAGTYMVGKGSANADFSVNACIQPQSDTILDLYGCVIQKETNGWESYNAIKIQRKKNITLLGGTIVGDNDTHDFVTSQGIHEGCIGINIDDGSKNIKLENMEITSFAGYSICLTGRFSQLVLTKVADWEVGALSSTDGTAQANANMMRMNKYIQLATLATISGQGITNNTTTNGGYFVIWGNGYGSYGTRYDGEPVNLSKSIFEIHCYDASGVYKGRIQKRGTDAIYLNTLPSGTTQFKLALRYDITQIIPSTYHLEINAFTFSSVIEIQSCKIHDSFSLAIAITGAQQILIENCEMYKIGNAKTIIGRRLYPFPMAIDIEDGANINQHIIIRNSIFRDNESLHISAVHARNLILENNKFDTPTNGNNGGVIFQGARGANLLSKNNYYNCSVGTGQENTKFQNDIFVNAQIQMQYETIYEGCQFENMSFQLDIVTYGIWSATAYDVGNAVLPTVKTGAWLSNPLYYVCITAGAAKWAVKRYFVKDLVINNNKIYTCIAAPATNSTNQPTGTGTQAYADGYTWQYIADNIEPVWKTDMTDTTDNANNVWRANVYYGDKSYETVRFKDCKINYTKIEGVVPWITRRGAVEFDSCKFNLTNVSGYFTDASSSSDYLGKNSFNFKYCEFISPNYMGGIKGDKITFSDSIFNGKAGSVSNAASQANELVVSNCVFNNFDIKLKGNPNTLTKNIYFSDNRIYLNKTNRTYGINNEGIFIQNFENVFIENNKAFMTSSSVVARALTIYSEKYVKITGNYFESANNSNKLELFGALRDATYTNAIPSLTAYIDNNYMIQYNFLLDPTYISQLRKSLGNGLTDINSPSVGSTDRISTPPTTGAYVLGQILYHSTPTPGGYLGWVCTISGIANATAWTAGTTYALNAVVNTGGNVYRCTATKGGPSMNQPTRIASVPLNPDGYSWLYLGPLAVFKTFGVISP